MSIQHLGRYTLTSCVAAAMLAGCGGSQPPIGAPGLVQSSMVASRPASSGDLLYVSSFDAYIYVFSYPTGSLVQSFQSTIGHVTSLCTDQSGDVFVTGGSAGSGAIYEYQHGGTTPIAAFNDPGLLPTSCSIDPTTGNVAITNSLASGYNVVVYDAQGSPTYYTDPNVSEYRSCAYDDQGNLYVDGQNSSDRARLIELPAGGTTFTEITIDKGLGSPGSLQWNSGTLAISAGHKGIYRLSLSGSTAQVVGETRVDGLRNRWWIDGATLLAPYGHQEAAYWKYPKGRKPTKILSGFDNGGKNPVTAVAISVGSGH